MVRLTRLFEPGMIGKTELKNRIIMAPMATFSCQDGHITDIMIDYYVERAKGGVGLIITQSTGIDSHSPGGKALAALWHDRFIPRLNDLTDAVHEYGAKIAVQLAHYGTMQSDPGRMAGYRPEDIDIVAPSAIPHLTTGVVPHELTKVEIRNLEEAWAEAARRARDAGCDAVEIHGAHGRLINQFASPFYNRRSDEYGGSPENRIRFACEVIIRTREKLGRDFPIIYRISGDDGYIGSTTKDEAQRQAMLLEKAGTSAIHVSSGDQAHSTIVPAYIVPPGPFVHLAEGIKGVVNIPVIAVGSLGDPVLAERVLAEEKADFVALGRPLLADPYWPEKAKEGRLNDIQYCLRCNNCMHSLTTFLIEGSPISRHLSCTINPALFREKAFVIKRTRSQKKIMVIGGGLAGMQAASILAERGHRVTLFEASAQLGGQWSIASQEKAKAGYVSILKTLTNRLEKAGVEVRLGEKADADMVGQERPDVVVLATGATPATLDIPGTKGRNVVQANDILSGRAKAGSTVVIIGGRYRGMDAAIHLAEQGKQVHLVTRSMVGRDTEHFLLRNLRDRLIELGVSTYPYSRVIAINEKGVSIFREKELVSLKADTIVLAVGSRPENRLLEELKGIAPEVYPIGDCVEPRSALEAINEGADVGLKI